MLGVELTLSGGIIFSRLPLSNVSLPRTRMLVYGISLVDGQSHKDHAFFCDHGVSRQQALISGLVLLLLSLLERKDFSVCDRDDIVGCKIFRYCRTVRCEERNVVLNDEEVDIISADEKHIGGIRGISIGSRGRRSLLMSKPVSV